MMLQEFWSYFMTTGNIDTYLNYKAYEQTYQNPGGYQTPKSGE